MQSIVILLICSIFSLDFLSLQLGILPRFFTWLPEILSMLVMTLVIARLGVSKSSLVPGKYKFFLFLFLLNIILGVLINTVPPGALISGIRIYFKFLPFFLLPFVFEFSEEKIKWQVLLVFLFLVLQAPLAIYQRLFLHAGSLSGDVVRGSIGSSSVLTIILASGIAILMAFYLAKRLKFIYFFALALILFIPMTINETKSSLIFIPLAIVGPLFMSNISGKLKKAIPVAAIGGIALVSFIVVYDAFMKPRWGYGLLDFLSMEGRTENYLYKGVEVGDNFKRIGKIDSFVLAIKVLSENPISLFFGLGIGNVTASFLSGLDGEYFSRYAYLGVGATALSLLLWETGLFGVLLLYMFIYLVYRDSLILRKQGSFIAVFSSGWAIVMVIMALVVPYINFIHENVVGYFFWYFSGLVAAKRYQWLLQSRIKNQSPSVL